MHIISRSGWGARAALEGVQSVALAARSEFVVHHSDGPAGQSVRAIQDWCMDGRGFLDIDYNFLIDQEGRTYVGRGWHHVGSHTTGHNPEGIGVCVIGRDELSAAAAGALRELYAKACEMTGRKLAQWVHGDLDQTECPGKIIREFVHGGGLEARTEERGDAMPSVEDLLNGRVKLTKATARAIDKGEGEEIGLGLLVQYAALNSANARLIGEATAKRVISLETKLDKLLTAVAARSEEKSPTPAAMPAKKATPGASGS